MDRLIRGMFRHKTAIILAFAAATLLGVVLQFGVKVNYNMVDYLPPDAPSTEALNTMKAEFSSAVPNARVMIDGVTVREAVAFKQSLKAIDGVSDVIWLDDVVDLKEPVEMADGEIVEQYYKDGAAVFSISIAKGNEVAILDAIRALDGDRIAIAGEAVTSATAQQMAGRETMKAVILLVPIVLAILLLTTTSWFEPVLFLAAIGVSVLINMGTNILFGEISYVTYCICPILQMAVSLDYAIFLLNSFDEFKKTADSAADAMLLAVKRSFPAVSASALTTFFGFIVLIVMRFRIGGDLGICLAKGIVLSLVSVLVLLPALTLACHKLIDKTHHRSFIPSFKKAGRFMTKVRLPALLLVVALVVPSYIAQRRNHFIYGMGDLEPASEAGMDQAAINERFGESMPIVLLVPRGDVAREAELIDALQGIDRVSSVVAYANLVGAVIPAEYVGEGIASQFYSKNYARIIVYCATKNESATAFATVENVRQAGERYYGAAVLSCGESANLYDVKDVVTGDNTFVNLLAIASIGLVLLFTFKSLSLPVILVMTIESAIWMNLAVSYLKGDLLCYIGFLVINTVQLGATVDYAILFTDHYMLNRKRLAPRAAAAATIGDTLSSILTSGATLASASFVLGIVSSNDVVSQLGYLLGRGTILSMALVFLFLPAAVTLLDGVIEKSTLQPRFFKRNAPNRTRF